uniref:Uncharacterized protein n=1 Tax=Opuntia streptacantha TaxID=393608 RepID=A0A7C8YYI3_OPUST
MPRLYMSGTPKPLRTTPYSSLLPLFSLIFLFFFFSSFFVFNFFFFYVLTKSASVLGLLHRTISGPSGLITSCPFRIDDFKCTMNTFLVGEIFYGSITPLQNETTAALIISVKSNLDVYCTFPNFLLFTRVEL